MRAWIVCVTYICLTLTEASGSLLPHFINKQAPVVTFSWWHQRNCGSLAQGSVTPLHVDDLWRRREGVFKGKFGSIDSAGPYRGQGNAFWGVAWAVVRGVSFFGSFSGLMYFILEIANFRQITMAAIFMRQCDVGLC